MICIDPGKDCGVAVFLEDLLDDCFLWEIETVPAYDDDAVPLRLPRVDAMPLIIEDQAVYPKCKNPQAIVQLAKQAARASQILGWNRTEWVEPRAWKGTLDGDLMTVRILQQLTPAELAVYFAATDPLPAGVRHNVADAVGIGLWKLGRLTPAKIAVERKTRKR